MIRFNEKKKANEIALVEIFSSLNGEGHSAGLPTVFIRTLGCNLRCAFGCDFDNIDPKLSKLCDTPESLCYENFKLMYPDREPDWLTAKEIFTHVNVLERKWRAKSICLTGGEPLLEENKSFMMDELIPLFMNAGYDVSIETNGSIDYAPYKERFRGASHADGSGSRKGLTIISDYKLPSSKMTNLMKESNFEIYDDFDIIKMVISDDEKDWEELNRILQIPTKAQFYISPMWGKVDTEKMWKFVEANADKNLKMQLQMHKFCFANPDQKGV